MVKADPSVPLLGVAIGLRAFFALILLAPLTLVFTLYPDGLQGVFLPFFVIYPLLVIGLLVYQIVALVNLTGQERRRKNAAAASMQQRMAMTGQPMPPLPPLPMPFTLRLRPNWLLYSLVYGPSFVVLLGVLGVTTVLDTSITSSDPSLISTELLTFIFPLVIIGGLFALTLFTLRQQIDVNQYGITMRRGFRTVSMAWETATLFAQVRGNPLRRDTKRWVIYELSNPQVMLRFAVPRTRWSPLQPQGMSREEFDRQMALLMHYISVRTGLPLIDVR